MKCSFSSKMFSFGRIIVFLVKGDYSPNVMEGFGTICIYKARGGFRLPFHDFHFFIFLFLIDIAINGPYKLFVHFIIQVLLETLIFRNEKQ